MSEFGDRFSSPSRTERKEFVSRRAILRWQQAGTWGHLGLRTDSGGIRFAGFVSMTDPRVLELLEANTPNRAESDMWEVHFTIPEPAYVPA